MSSDRPALRAYVKARDAARLDDARVIVSSSVLPGGSGPQGLPGWLPQDDTVWTSEALFILSPIPEVAPVASLQQRGVRGGR